ncbi:MAG: hypothetical protein ACI4M5_00635 [Christensenellales bacterium]
MKKLSILAIILVVCLSFSMMFSGCTKELSIQEGIEYLEAAIQEFKDTDTYYIKTTVVESNSASKEYKINKAGDAILYTVVTNQSSTTNAEYYYYYNGEEYYIEGKVNNEDVWTTIEKTELEFLLDPIISKYVLDKDGNPALDENGNKILRFPNISQFNKDVLVIKFDAVLLAMKTGVIVPKSISQGDIVTTYTFDDIGQELSAVLGGTTEVKGKYPLTIETINGRISKIVDYTEGTKIKYNVNYAGPKITIPKVKAAK